MESVAYVGMDVDKEKIAVALVQDYEDQPRMQRVIRNRTEAIEKFFGEVTGRYDQVLACYEAGACGFENKDYDSSIPFWYNAFCYFLNK
ncbi:hypothetical protein AU468_09660 [Alkalispirochaeta sphaeroplastigenens]|uniref:Uncharacterized protein n=1 Tax=Alkalispirochaeta sphaeroplastigenens TaxID=1187066 RepID=A0A2S4JLK5_9SPIO|nr:hypothetical protein AU468_09660 [Alkalispirochaeta sphaeroplastigenens]